MHGLLNLLMQIPQIWRANCDERKLGVGTSLCWLRKRDPGQGDGEETRGLGFFKKDCMYLFLERGEGREKKRERNMNV